MLLSKSDLLCAKQFGDYSNAQNFSRTLLSPCDYLSKKPDLYLSEALGYLSHTRQTTLLTGFTNALTRGGPSGLPRPIELHAHDPMRYVGDMLAWVHQAIAAEREFLEALFDVKGDRRMVGSVRTFQESEEEEWMGGLMDAAVGKLCTLLKVGRPVPILEVLLTRFHSIGSGTANSQITREQYNSV